MKDYDENLIEALDFFLQDGGLFWGCVHLPGCVYPTSENMDLFFFFLQVNPFKVMKLNTKMRKGQDVVAWRCLSFSV